LSDRTLGSAALAGLGYALLILGITLSAPAPPEVPSSAPTIIVMRQAEVDSLASDRLHIEYVTEIRALLDRVAAGGVMGTILDPGSAQRLSTKEWAALFSNPLVAVVDIQRPQLDALRRGDPPPPPPSRGGLGTGRFFAYEYRIVTPGGLGAGSGTRPLSALEATLLSVADRLPR
jgi:hypothetical protein